MNNNVNNNQALSDAINALQNSTSASSSEQRSWYLAFAKAWGNTLDNQANKLERISDQIGNQGNDQPSKIAELTAESLRFGFMAQNSATSLNTTGEALKTMSSKN
jgi:hypothetical protein